MVIYFKTKKRKRRLCFSNTFVAQKINTISAHIKISTQLNLSKSTIYKNEKYYFAHTDLFLTAF
jgi:hypothetical protein